MSKYKSKNSNSIVIMFLQLWFFMFQMQLMYQNYSIVLGSNGQLKWRRKYTRCDNRSKKSSTFV